MAATVSAPHRYKQTTEHTPRDDNDRMHLRRFHFDVVLNWNLIKKGTKTILLTRNTGFVCLEKKTNARTTRK